MSSPAKRKLDSDDSMSPTPTTQGTNYQYCYIVGACIATTPLQSPPSPIQRGLKYFGLLQIPPPCIVLASIVVVKLLQKHIHLLNTAISSLKEVV